MPLAGCVLLLVQGHGGAAGRVSWTRPGLWCRHTDGRVRTGGGAGYSGRRGRAVHAACSSLHLNCPQLAPITLNQPQLPSIGALAGQLGGRLGGGRAGQGRRWGSAGWLSIGPGPPRAPAAGAWRMLFASHAGGHPPLRVASAVALWDGSDTCVRGCVSFAWLLPYQAPTSGAVHEWLFLFSVFVFTGRCCHIVLLSV